MSNSDTKLIRLADIAGALGLLSRLPVPVGTARSAGVAWAFPVAGLMLGSIYAVLAWILLWLGVSANLTAGLVLFSGLMLTGAMHEDGLADLADGFWGGWDRLRRLEIMKDSQIGTYGVAALILSLALRWFAIAALISADNYFLPLIAVAILSRLPMVLMMAVMQNARGDGLSASVGKVENDTMWLALGLGMTAGVLLLGWSVIGVITGVALISVLISIIAQRKIGGQTGDVLGASQQLAEICALIILTL